MDETIYISICYLKGEIRLFKSTIIGLNIPSYVKIYVNKERDLLAITSDKDKTLLTHKIPKNIYDKKWKMIVYSKKLCNVLYEKMQWDRSKSYRIPGEIMEKGAVACFELKKANISG